MSNEEPSIAAEPNEVLRAREKLSAARTDTLPLVGGDFEGAASASGVTQAAEGSGADRLLASGGTDLQGVILSERYRVGECLGEGGMGTVWRAEHILMKKTVAIKVLHQDIVGHGEAVERFRREAQAAAHIDHPNVCVATDFGEMPERGFFLVMEYLQGFTLDVALARAGRFSPKRAIHIIDQVLSALEQAHQLGVIHRDLKPENIMLVERDGDPDFVKIMDFGIARVPMAEEQDDARLTRVGRIYGTPMYMSPEQASGETGIEARSDLYTVGAILFEMLSGTRPFVETSSAKLMAMHMTEPAPSLRLRVPEARLPRRLNRLVRRMMAKDPDERPASAKEVRSELARINQSGDTESWFSVARDVVDASSRAVQRAALPLRPHVQQARAWGMKNPLAQKLILAGLALLLLSIPLATLVFSSQKSTADIDPQSLQQQEQSLAEARSAYLEQKQATKLINALAMGDPEGALARIDALRAEHGEHAHLHFLSARAHMMNEQPAIALEHYRQAIDAEPRYASVRRVIDDLLEQFRAGSPDAQAIAEELLIHTIPAPQSNQYLSQMARMGEGSSLRSRARGALEKAGRLDELDAWNQASIELRFAQGCSAHRDAIEKIVQAADPRGLEVLYYYDERPTTGCGRNKREDCYGCIRQDLEDAIFALPAPDDAPEDLADEALPGADEPADKP